MGELAFSSNDKAARRWSRKMGGDDADARQDNHFVQLAGDGLGSGPSVDRFFKDEPSQHGAGSGAWHP